MLYVRRSAMVFALAGALLFGSCRKEPELPQQEEKGIPEKVTSDHAMWILSSGALGKSNARLDVINSSWKMLPDAYRAVNPSLVQGLGDTGNEIEIYGDYLYVVLTGSNKVEVIEAATGVRIGQLEVGSPRHIAFNGDYAYVTSYAGAQYGGTSVVKGKVLSFRIADRRQVSEVTVGAQPEGIAVVDGKLFVANSGGYNPGGEYEKTISAFSLSGDGNMKPLGEQEVEINLEMLRADAQKNLWVTSQGNYGDKGSVLIMLKPDPASEIGYSIAKRIEHPTKSFTISADTLFAYGVDYKQTGTGFGAGVPYYFAIDTRTGEEISNPRINDGSTPIATPSFIAVHPTLRFRFIGDAGDYVSLGSMLCFGPDGAFRWKVDLGLDPKGIAFQPVAK